MQHGLLCGGDARTSAERQAAASPGLSAFAGASAAKREIRVMAGGRSSSHATMRSILIAAAIATCCKWVFASPQYRVRRSPNARTPWERVPSMPARCPYCALPSALAYQVRASATASASARGGSPSLRPPRLARGHEVRGRGLTRLTDVDHVPGPRRVPLLAVARLDIVRGFDACGRGRQLAVLFESHLTHGRHLRGRRRLLCPLVVALPRPAQGLHVRQLAQPRGGFRGLQEVEEPAPILADRVGVRLACGRVLR